jgi:hypothetical protein
VKKTYSVNGTSNTRPGGLPEGFEVVEEIKTHDRFWATSRGGFSCKFEEFGGAGENPWIRAIFDNPVASFDMDTARKIGEWLIEVADSYKKELREYTTGSGSVWFEIEPEWFVTADDFDDAVMISAGMDRTEFGYDSFEKLTRTYPDGILSGETKLRKFSDGTSIKSHWYEVKPEWVVWASSRYEAETNFVAGGDHYGKSLDRARAIYSDDFKQVSE